MKKWMNNVECIRARNDVKITWNNKLFVFPQVQPLLASNMHREKYQFTIDKGQIMPTET